MTVHTDGLVVFTDAAGDEHVSVITRVWPSEAPNQNPLVNLVTRKKALAYTSVPCKSEVLGATGFYYE